MATLQLRIDPDRITVRDMLAVEENAFSRISVIREFLKKFVVDESGSPLPPEAALEQIDNLTLPQLREAMTAFGAELRRLASAPVPPPSSPAS